MSLVNQMLRDLKQQNKSSSGLPFNEVASSSALFKIHYLVICIALIAGIVLFIYQSDTDTNKIVGINMYAANTDTQTIQPVTPPIATSEKTLILETKPIHKEITLPVESTPVTSAVKGLKIVLPEKTSALVKDNSPDNNEITSRKAKKSEAVDIAPPKKISTRNSDSSNVITPSRSSVLAKKLNKLKIDYTRSGYGHTRPSIKSFVTSHPEFHNGRLFLISTAIKNNDPEVHNYLLTAFRKFPDYSDYRLIASRYFLSLNKYQQAESFLVDISSSSRRYFDLLKMRALTRQKLDNHRGALTDYSIIINAAPDRGDIHLAMGISFEATGQKRQARMSFQNALSDHRLTTTQRNFAMKKIRYYQG